MVKSIIAGAFTNVYKNENITLLLNTLHKKSQFVEFQNEFLLQLSNLSSSTTTDNNLIEESLDSAALFVVQSTLKNEQESRLFLSNIFNFICEKHEDKNSLFISRLYYFLNLIIQNRWKYNVNKSVNDYNDYWNKIIDTMFDKISHESIKIRIGAICVLGWFQNLKNNDCKILDIYIKYLTDDPSPEVRKTIINNIGINDKSTKALYKKIHDKNESVRAKAYIFFCLDQVRLNCLNIDERHDILKSGLQESDDILNTIKNKLLPTWIKFYNNNIINLLKNINCKTDSDCCIKILKLIFQITDINTITNELPLVKNLIPIDKLTIENIIYWYCFVIHCESIKNIVFINNIIPRIRSFTFYIQHFINMTSSQMNIEYQHNPWIFKLRKLFQMIKYILSIENNNNNNNNDDDNIFLINLIKYTLTCDYVYDDETIELATIYYSNIVQDLTSRINLLTLFIEIIKYPVNNNNSNNNSIKIKKKCLSIINGIIKTIPDNFMTNKLEKLFRNIVLDCFDNDDNNLKLYSLNTIGLFLLSNGEFAKKYIKKIYNVLLLSNDYPSDKWIISLNIIFDLYLKYGLDYFDIKYTDDDIILINNTPWFLEEIHSHILNNRIIKLLIKLIDYNKVPEIANVVIDGFWKLINNNIVTNSNLIKRILSKDVQIIHEKNIVFVEDKRRIKQELIADIINDNNNNDDDDDDVNDQVSSINIIDEKPIIINDQLLINNIIDESDNLNILNIDNPVENFDNNDNSNILWQGTMKMTDIAESSVTIDGFRGEIDNFLLTNLSNILNINSEICHRLAWSYITKLLKINSNNIYVFKITATNDEEKLSYITLWSYFNRRRKVGVIHNAIDDYDFFILSSASKKKNLPKFLGELVQEFLDNCDDRYLLLGIMCQKDNQVPLYGPKLLTSDHSYLNNSKNSEEQFNTSNNLDNHNTSNNEINQYSKKRNLQKNCDQENENNLCKKNNNSTSLNGTLQIPYAIKISKKIKTK